MPKITSRSQAILVWQAFFFKYKKIAMPRDSHSGERRSFKVTPNLLRYAIHQWQNARTSNTTIPVRIGKRTSEPFLYFFNRGKNRLTRKAINKNKLTNLMTELKTGNLAADIFRDPQLDQLALTLYQNESITSQQFYTLLDLAQNQKDFNLIRFYKILNAEGDLTEEAKVFLLPKFAETARRLNQDELLNFLCLVNTLPESERVFYITDMKSIEEDFDKRLAGALHKLDPLLIDLYEKVIIHPARGVLDAIGLAKFGVEEYVPTIPRLGENISLDEIEWGVRHAFRPEAVAYRDVSDYSQKRIHQFSLITNFEARKHDEDHAVLLSFDPNNVIGILHFIVDITREFFGPTFKWSKETWNYIDANFPAFYKTRSQRENPSLEYLLNFMLEKGNLDDEIRSSRGGFLYQGFVERFLTTVGTNIFIHMAENENTWLQKGINPKKLVGDMEILFYITELFLKLVPKELDRKLKVFLWQCFNILLKNKNTALFLDLLPAVLKNQKAILSQIGFMKLRTDDCVGVELPNMIASTYLGRRLRKDEIYRILDQYRVDEPLIDVNDLEVVYKMTEVYRNYHLIKNFLINFKVRLTIFDLIDADEFAEVVLGNWLPEITRLAQFGISLPKVFNEPKSVRAMMINCEYEDVLQSKNASIDLRKKLSQMLGEEKQYQIGKRM